MQKIDAVKSSKEGAEADAPKPKAKWNLFGGWRKEKDEDNPEFDDLEDEKAKNSIKQNIDVVVRVIKSFLELWPSPRSRFGRALEWRSDEDFARSVSPLSLSQHSIMLLVFSPTRGSQVRPDRCGQSNSGLNDITG